MTTLTRLDRLFTLIENGSNVHIRHTAACQVASVVSKQSFESFMNVLQKLIELLRNKDWDARVAAGVGIEKMLTSCPWKYLDSNQPAEQKIQGSGANVIFYPSDTFKSFEIDQIIKSGERLLASGSNVTLFH